jgi:predicted amidophosphoribosyltransferase
LAVADIQVLVPVVLHPWRRRWRGFDQAVLITRALAQLWGVPMILAVRRVRFTRPQIDLEPDQRRRNLARAFTAAPNVRLDNKTVAIVDDVWTTGATMDACARAVRTAGAGRVYGLTVTRSVPSWHPAAAERHTVTGA